MTCVSYHPLIGLFFFQPRGIMELKIDVSTITNTLNEIDKTFSTCFVKELDFMYIESVPTVLCVENCIGLGFPILKPLYLYCYTELLKPNLSDDTIMKLSRSLLLVKGDLIIAYNFRKRVLSHHKELLNDEIHLLSVIFSKHPKSPAAWEHRRWCYHRKFAVAGRKALLPMELETEKELSRVMAEKYPKNYYAWLHRKWLLQYFTIEQLQDELSFTHEWLHAHASDHSAVNHGVQVILALQQQHEQQQTEQQLATVTWELLCTTQATLLRTLIRKRPGQEALWYYGRNVWQLCLQHELSLTFIAANHHSNDNANTNADANDSIVSLFANKLQIILQKIITLCTTGRGMIDISFTPSSAVSSASVSISNIVEDHYLAHFDWLYHSLLTSSSSSSSSSRQVDLLEKEEEECLWNAEQQYRLAFRYLIFSLHQMLQAIMKHDDEVEEDRKKYSQQQLLKRVLQQALHDLLYCSNGGGDDDAVGGCSNNSDDAMLAIIRKIIFD